MYPQHEVFPSTRILQWKADARAAAQQAAAAQAPPSKLMHTTHLLSLCAHSRSRRQTHVQPPSKQPQLKHLQINSFTRRTFSRSVHTLAVEGRRTCSRSASSYSSSTSQQPSGPGQCCKAERQCRLCCSKLPSGGCYTKRDLLVFVNLIQCR
jgi:hypothetical protein